MTETPGESGADVGPGWRPDPYGRASERYFDGSKWTERISSRGTETVDPLGNTAAIAFSIPPQVTRNATSVKIWQVMTIAAVVQLVIGVGLLLAGLVASRLWLVLVGAALVLDAIVLSVVARRLARRR
jgi:hypothetical protein